MFNVLTCRKASPLIQQTTHRLWLTDILLRPLDTHRPGGVALRKTTWYRSRVACVVSWPPTPTTCEVTCCQHTVMRWRNFVRFICASSVVVVSRRRPLWYITWIHRGTTPVWRHCDVTARTWRYVIVAYNCPRYMLLCQGRGIPTLSYRGLEFNWSRSTILYIQGGAKNGAILSHCKYSENSMTELRINIANIFLFTCSLLTRYSFYLFSFSAWKQIQATDACVHWQKHSTNGVFALSAWYSRMGAISNICLNN